MRKLVLVVFLILVSPLLLAFALMLGFVAMYGEMKLVTLCTWKGITVQEYKKQLREDARKAAV